MRKKSSWMRWALSGLIMTPVTALAVSDGGLSAGSGLSQLQTSVGTSPAGESKNKLEVTAGLSARSLEDEIINSKYAGGTLGIVGSRKISEQLSGRLDLGFEFMSGSYTNQFDEAMAQDGQAPNVFYVNEAALTYTPWAPVSLEAGVIKTEFSSLPSTFEQMGFPALRESVQLSNENHQGRFFAMQAIPTSATGAVKPAEGGLITQVSLLGVSYSNDPQEEKDTVLNAGLTGFEFRNLNASAATDSQYLGNSVVSPGSQARFLYDFAGYETAVSVKQKFGDQALGLSGSFLRNERAPEGYNKAYLYALDYENKFAGRDVKLSGGYFYNEPDTLPASYASAGKGSNNRFGQLARVTIEDKKENIAGKIEYMKANEIIDRPYTADREVIQFSLEAKYEIL
ncbi:MAG: hypothetical protein KF802_09040 [Bdellovibrionaceae bacterium]|nr:hypothetical protein [Pseudobdellovibrionaceae bacterium]